METYIKELEALHNLKKQKFITAAESKRRQKQIFQEMQDKGIDIPSEYTQDIKTKSASKLGIIATSVLTSVLFTAIVMHFLYQTKTIDGIGDLKSSFQIQSEKRLNYRENTDRNEQYNNVKITPQDVPYREHEPSNNVELSVADIGIINKMPDRFIKAYQSGGTLQVSGERNKCYEAAKQIAERSLVIQCIALDAVGCGVVPIMEENNGFPSDPDFSKNLCFERALEVSATLYSSEIDRDMFSRAVIQRTIQEVNNYKWEDLSK